MPVVCHIQSAKHQTNKPKLELKNEIEKTLKNAEILIAKEPIVVGRMENDKIKPKSSSPKEKAQQPESEETTSSNEDTMQTAIADPIPSLDDFEIVEQIVRTKNSNENFSAGLAASGPNAVGPAENHVDALEKLILSNIVNRKNKEIIQENDKILENSMPAKLELEQVDSDLRDLMSKIGNLQEITNLMDEYNQQQHSQNPETQAQRNPAENAKNAKHGKETEASTSGFEESQSSEETQKRAVSSSDEGAKPGKISASELQKTASICTSSPSKNLSDNSRSNKARSKRSKKNAHIKQWKANKARHADREN